MLLEYMIWKMLKTININVCTVGGLTWNQMTSLGMHMCSKYFLYYKYFNVHVESWNTVIQMGSISNYTGREHLAFFDCKPTCSS